MFFSQSGTFCPSALPFPIFGHFSFRSEVRSQLLGDLLTHRPQGAAPCVLALQPCLVGLTVCVITAVSYHLFFYHILLPTYSTPREHSAVTLFTAAVRCLRRYPERGGPAVHRFLSLLSCPASPCPQRPWDRALLPDKPFSGGSRGGGRLALLGPHRVSPRGGLA